MRILVTGGAGFIGRWVVKRFLEDDHKVFILDNLSNGRESNIEEFQDMPGYLGFSKGNVGKRADVAKAFDMSPDICVHLAAQINIQESLDDPPRAFEDNIVGTYNVLEEARKNKTKVILMGTCMVYDTAGGDPIGENAPVKPASPYAGSKLAAEELALSYYYGLELPVVVLRPFNTYGPHQKTNMEGGVVSIFVKRKLDGKDLLIFGDGTQTRDLLYVEDCADFVVTASTEKDCVGEVLNAGTGKDVTINDLAKMIAVDENSIKHIEHHHPQSEIQRLVCDYSKSQNILGWNPKTTLEEGIRKLEQWMLEATNE